MKAFTAFILALTAAGAIAGTSVIEKPRTYEVHDASGAIEKDPATGKMREWPSNEDDCALRASKLSKGSCVIRRSFETVQNCADEKAPSVALVQETIDGQQYWKIDMGALQPPEPTAANGWAVMIYAYVHNPAWPLGMPNCWIRGFAPEVEWRLNPNAPGTPIMERITPGIADTSEPPNSIEPVPENAAFALLWHAPESEAARHKRGCTQCYSDDKTPCPPCKPNQLTDCERSETACEPNG